MCGSSKKVVIAQVHQQEIRPSSETSNPVVYRYVGTQAIQEPKGEPSKNAPSDALLEQLSKIETMVSAMEKNMNREDEEEED